jgi:uncharacterized BrkB/YihY/UPF0761 family membrane protein
MGGLVSGIVQDAQDLISQQFTLFKQEVRQDFQKTRDTMGILAVAAGVLFVGVLILGLMLVHLVQWLAPTWPEWVSYAIVGGAVTAVGALLAWLGVHRLRTVNPLPDQTAKALEENLEWKTKPN